MKPLKIGSIELASPIVLAPMAGVTNAPFRTLCREFASGLMYVNEMVMATALVHGSAKTERMVTFAPDESPRSLQLYGSDPIMLARAVTKLCENDIVDHIDMNFGCPVAKVTRKGGGAAVPAKPNLLRAIMKAAVKAAEPYGIPVTAKFRIGVDEDLITYLNTGRIAEEEGIASIASAFYPKPVIVRLSDFKSNEYANLIGGELYEPKEENPMLGFRGASRYVSEDFKACFALECEAVKRVRGAMGLDNVQVMIPFVRSTSEAEKVIAIMKENGLERGKDGLKLIMMCELPTNALLAEQYLQYFDGFSIGSNDLTQLTLGLDRDSALVADAFDERDEAVKALLSMAIKACKKAGKYVGICGQGPSDHQDFAKWLMQHGIDSMSLNPDSVLETCLFLAQEGS